MCARFFGPVRDGRLTMERGEGWIGRLTGDVRAVWSTKKKNNK